ncbi:TlpA family protein disulfide reductase [Microbacterium sp. NPDC055910]|uniref:TlpA family protein disulfide reductase n=1 Tax=Microbacterium sp. NPDC055910 TaxID=3345659 RepID=UPI0035D5D2FC
MRRLFAPLILVGALTLSACSPAPPPGSTLPGPVPEGVEYHPIDTDAFPQAPDAQFELLDGTVLSLSDLWSDRPVLLAFTESWCELCIDAQAELNSVVEKYGDAVTVISVAERSDVEQMTTFARDNDVAHLIARDPSSAAWKSYAVAEPPFLVVIGAEGTLLRGWRGVVEDLDGAVEEILVKSVPPTG